MIMTTTIMQQAMAIITSTMTVAHRTRDDKRWSRCLASVEAVLDAGTIFDEDLRDALDISEEEKFLSLRLAEQAHIRWVKAVNTAIEALVSPDETING